jgi:hypothetical protein
MREISDHRIMLDHRRCIDDDTATEARSIIDHRSGQNDSSCAGRLAEMA